VKDQNGFYYYPFPQNKRVRVYVRPMGDEIEFRMWNQDDPGLWMEHGWVPYSAIIQAKSMYKGGPFDPNRAYDISVAKALLKDSQSSGD
jgi:hypothetical protein